MLDNPVKAAESSRSFLFEKIVACAITLLTFLIINDITAIFVDVRGYRIIVTLLLDLFEALVLGCYVGLYSMFIPRLKELDFIKL